MARHCNFLFDRKLRNYRPHVADSIRLGQNTVLLGDQFRSSAEKYCFRNIRGPLIMIYGSTSQKDCILNRTVVTTKELAK